MQTLWLYLLFPQLQLDLSSNDISPEQAATPEPAVLLHPQDSAGTSGQCAGTLALVSNQYQIAGASLCLCAQRCR
ncbi:MAG: hypothetical protein U5L02_09400 [Rheinheimera sp.]|nr:hypothetical protein [Rheinheimera sp.]